MKHSQFKRNTFGLAGGALIVALAAPLVITGALSLGVATSSVAAEHSGAGKGGGADDFAAAANDYLQVIEFVHDNEVR